MKRARESWQAAVTMLSGPTRHPYSGVSRLFYAIFQASKADLLKKGHHHTRIPSSHPEFIIYVGKADEELGSNLQDLFNWRLKADYCNDEVRPKEANQLLASQFRVAQQLGLHHP